MTDEQITAAVAPTADRNDPTALPVKDIANALAQVRELHHEDGRTTLLDLIGHLLGTPVLLPGHLYPKAFFFQLTAICAERPRGLPALAEAVDYLAGASTPAAVRVRRLAGLVHDVLGPGAEADVQALLEGWAPSTLARIYHAAAGDSLIAPPARLPDAWAAMSILLDANSTADGAPRCLVFVELLVQYLEDRKNGRAARRDDLARLAHLQNWMTSQRSWLGAIQDNPAVEALRRVRAEPALLSGGAAQPVRLVLGLEPADDAGRFWLSHWRQYHPTLWRPEPGPLEQVTLATATHKIAELIHEAESGWAYELNESPLLLEFLLPEELINLDVDQWSRDSAEEPLPAPLGVEYQVLIRSRERAQTPSLHRAWRQRWVVLAGGGGSAIALDGTRSPRWLRDQLATRPEVGVCLLSGPPDREPGRTEFRTAIRWGVPAVVWFRARPDPATRQALLQALDRPDVGTLLDDIRRIRAGDMVSPNDDQPLPLISLVLDDPGCFLPEPLLFQQPQIYGE